jgi:hypothetical protein
MDNIQLCYIDNEINKIDKMKQGDVIYKNGMELLVVLSYDHGEPCRGCFFYKDKKCGSERLIKCWNCNKEYIFTVIRENDTTELDKMTKRHKEAYEKMLNITKRIERDRRSTANRVFAILGKNLIVNIFDKTIITSKNPNGLTFIRVYQRPNII